MVSILLNPSPATWPELCQRAVFDDSLIETRVRAILQRVKAGGDNALRAVTTEIDGSCPNSFLVSEAEFERAALQVPDTLKDAIQRAKDNIERFHKTELPASFKVETMPGVACQRRWLPIQRVGLYIPGGSAPLFSTIPMLAIPARLAGCPEIILCTPSGKAGEVNPIVLWTARLCGINTVYKLGGAQAIGAMAYGTESIRPVNKIFGPGNRYVTKAKQIVSIEGTAIDMPAGPSEIMVLADESASPAFIAADMLSQAEHGPDSQAMVVCPNEDMANAINVELERQLARLPRATVADKALANSRIIVFNTKDEAERNSLFVRFANAYASEHLLIETSNPWIIADKITAAGSIFIGHHSPESAGDYASGTNHTLPTMGYAKAYNGIGVDSFMHAITYQELSPEGLAALSTTIIDMAEAEGLDAHANAVRVRMLGVTDCQTNRLTDDSPAHEQLYASLQVCQSESISLVRPNIASLAPYSTARDEYKGDIGIFLDANENPYNNGYNRYPDPRQKALKAHISALKGIAPARIFIGNGSDEAIDLCFRIFCTPGVDNAIAIRPSYGMYRVAADINDVEVREVQLNDDFSLPVEALLARADSRSKLLFLCSPNNPTGNCFPLTQMEEILRRFGGMVVVDEAYIDFAEQPSLLTLLDKYPNLIVLQTLSKAYGMAGLRLGLAFASEEVMQHFANVKYPYNINLAAMELAEKLLARDVRSEIEMIKKERARIAKALAGMPCVYRVYPSDANFLLVKVQDADALYDCLIAGGVIVRNRSRVPGCENCLRITLGTPEENDRMLALVKGQLTVDS